MKELINFWFLITPGGGWGEGGGGLKVNLFDYIQLILGVNFWNETWLAKFEQQPEKYSKPSVKSLQLCVKFVQS